MIQIDDPPTAAGCWTCHRPLLWLFSARTQRWVSFVPAGADSLLLHRCTDRGKPPSWRDTPTPAVDSVRKGAARVRAALKGHDE